jgi:hypothetical protein
MGQSIKTASDMPTVVKIFYFPFEAHTTIGISEASIERDSIFKIQIVQKHPRYYDLPSEHRFVSKLKQLLMQNPSAAHLEKGQFRLKLQLPGDIFFVDANGRVLRIANGQHFQLSVEQMKEVGREIEYLAGVVDTLSVEFTNRNLSEK